MYNLQRLDISELYGAEGAPAHEGAALWEALQNIEVLNLKMGKFRNEDGIPYSELESIDRNSDGVPYSDVGSDDQNSDGNISEVDSDDENDPVTPSFFQSISAMTRLR